MQVLTATICLHIPNGIFTSSIKSVFIIVILLDKNTKGGIPHILSSAKSVSFVQNCWTKPVVQKKIFLSNLIILYIIIFQQIKKFCDIKICFLNTRMFLQI